MSHSLPERPNLGQLKKQAKRLLAQARAGEPAGTDLIAETDPRPPALHDAQRALARHYGFLSWNQLRLHVESVSRLRAPFEQLSAAVKADEANRVRELLGQHPELRPVLNDALPDEAFGASALHVAAQRNARAVAEVLLDQGANPAARTHWWAGGFALLDDAAPDLVPWLMERGAPVDAVTAARLGHFERLRELVTADRTTVHARGGDGQTPLHVARTVEIARFLLDHGAQLDAQDVDHESTPAQYALSDRLDVARLLIARGCRTDLLMAAAVGDRALAARHLATDPGCIALSVSLPHFPKRNPRAGGPIYIWKLGWHTTAHDLARRNHDADLLALLMEASPPILRVAKACAWADEPLAASLGGFDRAVRPVEAEDRGKIVQAAQLNRTASIALFLRCGWPIDARGEGGATALHWASWHGNVEVMLALLRAKAPVEAKDDAHASSPLSWCLHGSLHSWFRTAGDYALAIDSLREFGATVPGADDEIEASDEALAALRR